MSDKKDKIVDLREELQHSQIVYSGKLLHLHRDVVRLSHGREEIREVLRHPGAAVIVPHLGQGRFILVRQYRYAISQETLEFPAGRLDPPETPLAAAQRELKEETGYTAQSWRHLFSLHPAPGYTDEILEIFLAEGLSAGEIQLDVDEQVLVEVLTLEQLRETFQRGHLTDAKTHAALFYLLAFPETWTRGRAAHFR